MLIVDNQLASLPVLSIHASSVVAHTNGYILNPHNLTIAAFYVDSPRADEPLILMPQDIREMNGRSLVINHEEDLAPEEDIIRLQELIDLDFSLVGKPVYTESGKKLGTVTEFVVQTEHMAVFNMHVQPPAWKSLMKSDLIISRKQVVEVSQESVIVRDAVIKQKATAPQAVPTS